MSLVKKNRMDHFNKNKQNKNKRIKKQAEQLRQMSAEKKGFEAARR